jgi:signal transduction histidine kinase
VLWLHPAFIAVTLIQSTRVAQCACWLVIALLSGVLVYYDASTSGQLTQSVSLVNHWIIIFSLCASTVLLYGLSHYREMLGADRARLEVLQQSETALRAEVKAKEQARAELEQANAVVAGFLDNMSHELRTPLNGIIGFSELVHGEMFGPLNNKKYKEYVGDILDSGQHMLNLVNNLLYFSQLSAGRIRPVLISLEMLDKLNEAAGAVRTNDAAAGIEIEVGVEGSPFLTADSTAISRMLVSLLDNAIKFSMSGGKIYLNGQQKPDGQCEICVRDTGVGIEESELDSVLLPFHKGGQSKTNAIPGSGMGLALTKILMDLHGGSVSIDSAPGKGTCVRLLFPAQAAYSPAD